MVVTEELLQHFSLSYNYSINIKCDIKTNDLTLSEAYKELDYDWRKKNHLHGGGKYSNTYL